jgi:hypothetical protein
MLALDYEPWKRRELWTIMEAASLIAGIDPIKASRGQLGGPSKRSHYHEITQDTYDAISLKTLECIPAYDAKPEHRQVRPSQFLIWAASRGHLVPDALHDLVPVLRAIVKFGVRVT